MKLHIGCGSNYIKGWINSDISYKVKTDVKFDATKKFPFENNYFNFIYSEHFIEHLTEQEGLHLFSEFFRVLKPSGVIRISTPDLDNMINRYIKNDIKTTWKPHPETSCEYLNRAMRKWEHKFIYNAEQIIKTLKNSGFSKHYPVESGKSKYTELSGLETRENIKFLIYEGIK